MLRDLSTGLTLMAVGTAVMGAVPTAAEMAEARAWAMARFEGKVEKPQLAPGLTVLANNDPVQRNARNGRPMNISGQTFTRGLYCHAVSKVVVRLPGPGKTFSAVVGVDSNEQTSGGRGSVVFRVDVGNTEAYRSDVLREGMPGVPVALDLGGSLEFTLEVDDAGDGIACDQSDWADAKVVLENGETVWLGDLPILRRPQSYSTEPPFSFVYGGRHTSEALPRWNVKRSSRKMDGNRRQTTRVWRDPDTALEVRCVSVTYEDYPTVEWTVYLRNAGKTDTPIIERFAALDVVFERGADGEFVLNHNVGSPCTPTDYRPLQDVLPPGTAKRVATSGGRPTNSDLPYFNIEWPGEGVIAVLGWPGQWAADFVRDGGNRLRVTGGQELTHFRLHPGEEVRSPLVVLQFWQGDRDHAQNVWRQWMLAHNVPRSKGRVAPSHLAACSSHQFGEMIGADEASQKQFIDRYLAEGLKLDYWWMDAGWYVCGHPKAWPNTGTWEVDRERFPNGLRAITDHGRARGVNSIVWFEPERVTPGSWLYEQHPEWLLGKDGGQKLLNLGNPDARKWLADHVDQLLKTQGIDFYRQDFNMDPLAYWRANDPEDRQGITENHHVTGYLAFWDELRRRHPDMLIDTCASGGRRNDLETLRRAVPLLRSDYILEPTSQQNHTYGIASWIPLYGTGVNHFDAYGFRSAACPFINACYDVRKTDSDWESVRRLVGEWRSITRYYYGDFHPLTPYGDGNDVWMAWQFNRPDIGEGMVQAFRRPNSVYESARLKLKGLDPAKTYRVSGAGSTDAVISGAELMETGLLVTLPSQPDSAQLTYKAL